MNYPTQPQYQPPRRRLDRGKIIAFSFLGVLALIIAVSVIASAAGGGSSDTAADTSSTAPAEAAAGDKAEPKGDEKETPKEEAPEKKAPKTEKPEPKPASEADDLTSIQLDDRSEYGITDIWVTYTVKNNSSKASDYWIKYEVTDSAGTRVYNDELYATNVQPGQTANEEMFTTLESMEGMKLTVTEVDRTEAW